MKIQDEKTLQKLRYMSKHGKSLQERRRSHALVLSHEGYTKKVIASILQVSQRSIFLWQKEFKEKGADAILPKKGRGRKVKLSSKKHLPIIKEIIETYPNQPKKAYTLTLEAIDVKICYNTFKNFLKKHLA